MIERTPLNFLEELRQELWFYGIPVHVWGTGTANSLEDLVRELLDGESKLYFEDGKVVRVFDMLDLDVFYIDDGVTYKLKEDRQEYVNGRVRRRPIKVSLMEKMKPGEESREAVSRALAEELNVTGEVDIKDLTDKRVFEPSYPYPGTFVDSTIYKATVYLSKEQYNPKGYKEVQQDRKTTYFVWERLIL